MKNQLDVLLAVDRKLHSLTISKGLKDYVDRRNATQPQSALKITLPLSCNCN
jgi:hypothetical protein